jgi:hypothetical protein
VPTTIHIPDRLLEQVDIRAKALGISRNRVILDALQEKLGARNEWTPELVALLARPPSSSAGNELEASLAVVRAKRRNRRRETRL